MKENTTHDTSTNERAVLIDEYGGEEPFARTTSALLGSLVSRIAALMYVSGFEAIGSQIAGFAALGREARQTSDGARMANALESSSLGANGEALWSGLKLTEWLSKSPPSPVLNDISNDLALLLSPDLYEALHDLATGELPIGRSPLATPHDVSFVDAVVGFWVLGRRLVDACDAIAAAGAATIDPPPTVSTKPKPDTVEDGSFLR